MRANVAREEAKDRRTIAKVQVVASLLLLASTLFAWENHPRVEYQRGTNAGYYVHEVGHTIGVVTKPAGPLAIVLGVVALVVANRLRRVRWSLGWWNLGLALATLGVSTVEIIQLMLGRRDWIDHVSQSLAVSTGIADGVGIGVWIAALASTALVASAATYVWLAYRLWRKNPAVTD
jgi:hypothetical protein